MIQINMPMPKRCFDCPCSYMVLYGEYKDDYICNVKNYVGIEAGECLLENLGKRPKDCPMTEVKQE